VKLEIPPKEPASEAFPSIAAKIPVSKPTILAAPTPTPALALISNPILPSIFASLILMDFSSSSAFMV
jgi:hypothetical protein